MSENRRLLRARFAAFPIAIGCRRRRFGSRWKRTLAFRSGFFARARAPVDDQKMEKKLPAWTDMVKGTTVLSRRSIKKFFDDATVMTERKFLFPKSYIAYKR